MLHAGYLTCHSTPISDDGELEQGWFERLRRMYHESCECDESISEKKRKKVA